MFGVPATALTLIKNIFETKLKQRRWRKNVCRTPDPTELIKRQWMAGKIRARVSISSKPRLDELSDLLRYYKLSTSLYVIKINYIRTSNHQIEQILNNDVTKRQQVLSLVWFQVSTTVFFHNFFLVKNINKINRLINIKNRYPSYLKIII